jgi:hypothetical protein
MAMTRLSNSSIANGFPRYQTTTYSTNKVVVDLSPTFWLDASDSSTLTLSGSNVTTWADKSGNSRNFTQGTSSNGPVYNATGLMGKPTLEFDGNGSTGKWLDFGSSGFPLFATSSSPVTLFGVVEFNNPTFQQFWLTWNKSAAPSCTNFECGIYDQGGTGGSLVHGIHAGCSYGFRGGFPGIKGSYVITLQLKATGTAPANTLLRINGSECTPLSSFAAAYPSAGSYPTTNGTVRIGARKDGDASTTESTFNGAISEVILYKSELSAANIASVENYLINKWSIV